MPRLYATTEQAWPSNPPANADLLLRTASRIVDVLLTTRRYDVDDQSMPTNPDDVQALQDATVTIAHDMEATGALESSSSVDWGSVSIGSVSLSNPTSSASAVQVAGVSVPPVALIYLSDVGTRWVRS